MKQNDCCTNMLYVQLFTVVSITSLSSAVVYVNKQGCMAATHQSAFFTIMITVCFHSYLLYRPRFK